MPSEEVDTDCGSMGRSVVKKPATAMKKMSAAPRHTARCQPKYQSMSLEAWTEKYYPNDVKERHPMATEKMDIGEEKKNRPRSKHESPTVPVVNEVQKLLQRLRQQGEALTVEQLGWNVMDRLDEAWFTGSVPGIERVARLLQDLFYPHGGFRPSKNPGTTADVLLVVDAIWRDAVNFAQASCEKDIDECQ